jgi:hypothetical protein
MKFVEILSAVLVPITTVLTLYIAWQQWRTNHQKVRHDLYERRLAYYVALMEFLACIVRSSRVTEAEMKNFSQQTRESYFLLGPGLAKYMHEIWKRSADLLEQSTTLDDPKLDRDEKTRVERKRNDILKWLAAQFEDAQHKFAKCMRLW